MSQQPKVFRENYIDLLNSSISITITDAVATDNGQNIVDFMRNRSLNSAWITTGSTDVASTQIDIDMGDAQDVDNILLLGHNLKNYTIHTWNGATYDLAYTGSNDTNTATYAAITEVSTSRIRIIITGAQTVDADKYIKRLLVTKELGTFNGFPQVKAPTHTTNKKKTNMLSGKINITEGTGAFRVSFGFDNFQDNDDLQLVEDIYRGRKGVNISLSGGDGTQFNFNHVGYRKEDVYLMRPNDDYKPEFAKAIYSNGTKQTMKLVETIR